MTSALPSHRAHLVVSGMLIAGRGVIARALAFIVAIALGTLTYATAWTP